MAADRVAPEAQHEAGGAAREAEAAAPREAEEARTAAVAVVARVAVYPQIQSTLCCVEQQLAKSSMILKRSALFDVSAFVVTNVTIIKELHTIIKELHTIIKEPHTIIKEPHTIIKELHTIIKELHRTM